MQCAEVESGLALTAVVPGHCKCVDPVDPVGACVVRSDSPGSHSSTTSAVAVSGGVGSMAGATFPSLALGCLDGETAVNGTGFGTPGWRDGSALVPESSASVGPRVRSPQSEVNSHDAEGESTDGEQLLKDFVAGLASYFQVEGHVGGIQELRMNANALGSRRGPPSSSSQFRGVTRHRRTKKWESHIWYNKKQLYLGGFKEAVDAAKAHDIMALKLRGSKAHTNFEPSGYSRLLPFLETLSMEQVIEALRLVSKGTDFGAALKKPFRTSRTVKHHRLQGPVEGLLSSADDDASLVHVANHIVDNISATLLPPPIWTKDAVRDQVAIEDLSNPVMMSTTPRGSSVADLLSSTPIETASAGLMEDGIDATWAPIMCSSEAPLFPNSQSSPFLQFSQPLDLGPGPMEQRPQSEIRSELEMLCGQSPRDLISPVVPVTQRTASDPLPGVDEAGFSVPELLRAGTPSARQLSSPIVGMQNLYPQEDSLLVKVPVYQSKVVQFPNGATRAASLPVQMAGTLPVDQSLLWSQNPSEAYASHSMGATLGATADAGVLRSHPETTQVSVNTSYPAGVRDIECNLQAGGAMSLPGQYRSDQYGAVLDSHRNGLMRVSSTSGAVLGLTGERAVQPGGHCL